jgi:hypothetical protein
MINHPNRSKAALDQAIPVYLKGGFKMRETAPIGYAKDVAEATALVKAAYPAKEIGANNNRVTNGPRGVERLQDEQGQYFVGRWQMHEI